MNDLRVKYLSYDPKGGKRLLHIEFDPGDGSTISHRTALPSDPDVYAVTSSIENGWEAALRMVRARKSPEQLPKLPEAIKSLIAGNDVYREPRTQQPETRDYSLYDDPDYTVGAGPIDPHVMPLDAEQQL